MKTFSILFLVLWMAATMAACCSGKKQSKDPAAQEALPDRNTKDPRVDSLNRPVEKIKLPQP